MEYVTTQTVEVPALGFGTARLTGGACRRAVEDALEIGYRHIDTAQMYDNEEAVGQAIQESGIDRKDLFLVTKVRRGNLAYDDVLTSVQGSVTRLGTYIDLLLIHAPSRTVPIRESVRALNQLQADGNVEHIGVSNFSVDQLREAMATSETPIITNQVKYHPFENQTETICFCINNDLTLTAYSPLAQGRVKGNEILRSIGKTHDKTEAQIALRWLLQQEQVCAIPKAATQSHRQENFRVFDFQLSGDEMRQIFDLHNGLTPRLRDCLGI